jgi:predicted DNA-binding transcriptional regulator YafY
LLGHRDLGAERKDDEHLRSAPRSLRLDRIERARVIPTPFRLREAPSMMIEVGQFFAPL